MEKLDSEVILPSPEGRSVSSWSQSLIEVLTNFIASLIDRVNGLIGGNFDRMQMTVLKVAPTNPEEGLIVWADGTEWDPGSGAGLYEYRSSTWNKL